jgi:hypothetical protein
VRGVQCIKCKLPYNNNGRGRTFHHLLPRRFYGIHGWCLEICRACHTELETLIPEKERMSDQFYTEIVFHYLQVKSVRVVAWSSRHDAAPIVVTIRRYDAMPQLPLLDL